MGASSGQLGDGSAVLLSAAQRRRRSLYFCDALPDTRCNPCQSLCAFRHFSTHCRRGLTRPCACACSGGGPATAGGEPSLAPALLERPAFAAWLEREVQALLLEVGPLPQKLSEAL